MATRQAFSLSAKLEADSAAFFRNLDQADARFNKLHQNIQKLTSQIDKDTTRANASLAKLGSGGLGSAANSLSQSGGRFTGMLSQISGAAQQHASLIEGALGRIRSAASGLASGVATLGKIGLGAGLALGGAAVGAALSTIPVGQDYGAVLNRIQAVSRATDEEMRQVDAQALKLGRDLPISSKDAAEGMYALVTAGYSVKEALAASSGVAQLAASQMMPVGEAAEIVAASLRGFKMSADWASEADDLLSQTAASSAVEVRDVGETLKYVGPVAGAAGLSLKDVSVAIGLMGNQMVKGSMAGTALRAILERLIKPPKEAKEWLQSLGVTITDESQRVAMSTKEMDAQFKEWNKTNATAAKQRQVIDALSRLGIAAPLVKGKVAGLSDQVALLKRALDNDNLTLDQKNEALSALGLSYTRLGGKMLPLTDIIRQFRDKFKDMSQDQRQQAAASIAGAEAMAGFLSLVDASDDDFDRMVTSIEGAAGATDRFAKNMNRGAKFEAEQLKGSLETLAIKGFQAIEPIVVSVEQKLTSGVNTIVSNWDRVKSILTDPGMAGISTKVKVKSIAEIFGLPEDAAAQLGDIATKIETAWNKIKEVMGAEGVQGKAKALGFDPTDAAIIEKWAAGLKNITSDIAANVRDIATKWAEVKASGPFTPQIDNKTAIRQIEEIRLDLLGLNSLIVIVRAQLDSSGAAAGLTDMRARFDKWLADLVANIPPWLKFALEATSMALFPQSRLTGLKEAMLKDLQGGMVIDVATGQPRPANTLPLPLGASGAAGPGLVPGQWVQDVTTGQPRYVGPGTPELPTWASGGYVPSTMNNTTNEVNVNVYGTDPRETAREVVNELRLQGVRP